MARQNGSMRVAGANVAGGRVYLCVVDATEDDRHGLAYEGGNHRFDANERLAEADRLLDHAARIRQHLEPMSVDRVVLTQVRKYNQWKYRDAYIHVTAVSALMIATQELGLPFQTVTTEEIGRSVNVGAKALQDLEVQSVGYVAAPRYWTAGLGAAHAAAAHALVERGATA